MGKVHMKDIDVCSVPGLCCFGPGAKTMSGGGASLCEGCTTASALTGRGGTSGVGGILKGCGGYAVDGNGAYVLSKGNGSIACACSCMRLGIIHPAKGKDDTRIITDVAMEQWLSELVNYFNYRGLWDD